LYAIDEYFSANSQQRYKENGPLLEGPLSVGEVFIVSFGY